MTIKINGEAISDEAIEYELGRLIKFFSGHMSLEQVRSQMDAIKQKAVDQAIGAKLLIGEAEKIGITVSVIEVDEKMNEMVKNAGGEEAFAELIKTQKMTEDGIRETIERGSSVDKLIEKITAGINDPSEDELKEHFEGHKDEYKKSDRVQAQHILLQIGSDAKEADKESARSKLIEIKKKVDDGEDFADLAACHSDCPSGKSAGGSLGWISRGMLVPEFDKELFAMDDDSISDVVESPLGFHLIRKLAHEEGAEVSFEEARESVVDFLRHVKRGEVIAAYVKDLRSKAVVEEV